MKIYNKESLKKSYEALKKRIDGEPKNIDPLKEIPEPLMVLYGVNGNYFETKEELKSYCEKNKTTIETIHVLEYLGNVAGRIDVIRKTSSDGTSILYTAVDRDGYGMYNHRRSVYRGEFIWEYNYGNIREMYTPFKNRGIIFENDVYGRIEKYDKKIMEMVKKEHLFNQ